MSDYPPPPPPGEYRQPASVNPSGPPISPAYPAPPEHPPAYPTAAAQSPSSGKAVAALVLGILGIVSCQPLGIAAIIVGNQAAEEIAASGGRLGGDGMAKVGVILGWIAVALLALVIVGFAFFFIALAVASG